MSEGISREIQNITAHHTVTVSEHAQRINGAEWYGALTVREPCQKTSTYRRYGGFMLTPHNPCKAETQYPDAPKR